MARGTQKSLRELDIGTNGRWKTKGSLVVGETETRPLPHGIHGESAWLKVEVYTGLLGSPSGLHLQFEVFYHLCLASW